MTTPASSTTTAAHVPSGSIVVGVDGSSWSGEALRWATEQARLEHRPLTITYSYHLGPGGDSTWMGQPGIDVGAIIEQARVAGGLLLDSAATSAKHDAPELEVYLVLSQDDVRNTLLELAERAALVVLGSRGLGTVRTLLLGSVSVSVSKHAVCPVVVVRRSEGERREGGILVGVDGTEDSLPAIDLAFRLASLRSLPLTALHVFWDVTRPVGDGSVADHEAGFEDERALLSESLAGMREKFPEVECHLMLAAGLRDQQLVRASHEVALVVVGSRRRGALEDLLRGSVAPTVVERAACDVVVVPVDAETR